MSGFRALVLFLTLVVPSAFAANYDISWSQGTDYSGWASDKNVQVGDTVTFQYVGGLHSVDEVRQADYAACSGSNTISSNNDGNTAITLATPGTHYFICGTAGHCAAGMKIAIPVSAAGSTPSTTPSTPGTSPTPATPKSTPSGPNKGANGAAAAGFHPGKALLVGAFLASLALWG